MTVKRMTPGVAVRALVGLALLAGACAPSGTAPSSSVARPDGKRATAEKPHVDQDEVNPDAEQEAFSGQAAPDVKAPEGPEETGTTGLEPTPAELPWKSKVPVEATVTPACVDPGGTVTIEVTTKPEAAIAYSTVYAGNQSGAGPPFGHGYGGNDKGYASKKEGRWESTWIVRLDAPRGPAKVDVVVGYRGKFGYDDPHFAVADKNGKCPETWLASKDKAN